MTHSVLEKLDQLVARLHTTKSASPADPDTSLPDTGTGKPQAPDDDDAVVEALGDKAIDKQPPADNVDATSGPDAMGIPRGGTGAGGDSENSIPGASSQEAQANKAASFQELAKKAAALGNELLASVVTDNGDPEPAEPATNSPAGVADSADYAAGYKLAAAVGLAETEARSKVAEMVRGVIQDANYDADALLEYLQSKSAEIAKLAADDEEAASMTSNADDTANSPSGCADESAPAPVPAPAPASEPDPSLQGGGPAPTEQEIMDMLITLLSESGQSPEAFASADLPPAEEVADPALAALVGDGSKMAAALVARAKSAEFKLKTATDASSRRLKNQLRRYLQETGVIG